MATLLRYLSYWSLARSRSSKLVYIYRSPGVRRSVAEFLWSSPLLTIGEWKKLVGDESADVVVDGHTWFSLSSASIHVWVHLPDHGIDID